MLYVIAIPSVILAAMAFGFRQPVGASRTAEALIPALLALLPLVTWFRLDPVAAAWFPLIALAMSVGFWVLAVLSLSGRQWPRQSAKSRAASSTVWALAAVFGVLQASRFLQGAIPFRFAWLSYAPWSLLITALVFTAFCLHFWRNGRKTQGA